MAGLSFPQYVQVMKKQAENADLIVIGNQSADLDSIASTLVLAWHLENSRPDQKTIALIAISRKKLRLRPEVLFVLKKAGIDKKDLLFLDEIDLESTIEKGTKLVLVDHNHLPENIAVWESKVCAVIDHHNDEGTFTHARPRIIEKVGSTATLVTELVVQEGGHLDAPAAQLLLSAVLIDTVNLSDESGRCTGRDKAAAARLLAACGEKQNSYYQRLRQAQLDFSSLSSLELLEKDYKEWPCNGGKYGMSTVLLSLTDWQQRETKLEDVVTRFAMGKGLYLLIVMLASENPDFQREMILFGRDRNKHDELIAYLNKQALGLSLISEKQHACGFLSFYQQGNTFMSRKKLQPLIHRLLAEPKR